jgi:hypothetical protein
VPSIRRIVVAFTAYSNGIDFVTAEAHGRRDIPVT